MDVDGLMATTPSHVFEEWKSYHKMVRWGEDWDQTAQLTAVQCGGNKSSSAYRPKYVPPAGSGGKFDAEQQLGLLNQLVQMNQARANRGGR